MLIVFLGIFVFWMWALLPAFRNTLPPSSGWKGVFYFMLLFSGAPAHIGPWPPFYEVP
jgi:hypothetical protein